jgi:hypothetical protein
MAPQPPKNSLDDIIVYFSQFVHLYQNAPLRIHDDYLIESSVGCFRIGYSAEHQCTALFYARHPDDLTVVNFDGKLEFAHKERVYLVGTHKIHNNVEGKEGEKLHFDNGWVLPLIHHVIYSLPRILLREANVFRLGDEHYSQYVTYQPVPVDGKDVVFINIFTNPHMTYNLAAVEPPPLETSDRNPRRFRRAALECYRRATSSRFLLQVKKEVEEGDPIKVQFFEKKDISTAILSDFHSRAYMIWNGRHPVTWREKHALPIFHATANLRWEFTRLIEHLKDKENSLRFWTNWGALGALNYFFSIVGYNAMVRRVTEFGRLPEHPRIRKEIFPMVRKHLRRLATMRSDLNGLLLRPEPSCFGDFEAINSDKHVCSFVPDNAQFVERDQRREFGSWVKRHFYASYVAGWRFYGPDSNITDTAQFREAVVLKQSVSNGLKIYVLPHTKEMFACFHDDGFEAKHRKFPCGTEKYLKTGRVLRFDLNDMNDGFTDIPFKDFHDKIRGLTSARQLEIQPAQAVPGERINTNASLYARGDLHPINFVVPFGDILPK